EENIERRAPVQRLAGEIYPRVLHTTEVILEFNDRYDPTRPCEDLDMDRLTRDLSQIGETLAERIDLEDRLIQTLTQSRN
ncbi:MAG TPA: Rsd/AlgQ family anti-sigma factor, partial [Chromatiales bacterium]|nr:Rsd/AlgQ family anti-sigma factor [Chromatiales bacterium]